MEAKTFEACQQIESILLSIAELKAVRFAVLMLSGKLATSDIETLSALEKLFPRIAQESMLTIIPDYELDARNMCLPQKMTIPGGLVCRSCAIPPLVWGRY